MQYGSSRNPMTFRKVELDPYQQAFLQNTSSLKEHKYLQNVRMIYILAHITVQDVSLATKHYNYGLGIIIVVV